MAKALLTLSFIIVFTHQGLARVSLNTQCTKLEASGPIEGLNINTPYTIASVTKVFTSHWALAKLGPHYRFSTAVYITPVAKGLYDVHFEGSHFPYFDKDMFQFFIGELNRLGVQAVNKLTFDENFYYASDVRYSPSLAHGNANPDVIEIMKDLRRDTLNINQGLARLNAKALAAENQVLPASLSIRIHDIHFREKMSFQANADTQTFILPSSELFRQLKEMNRNSNNFVADKLFLKLSEHENYQDFILNRLLQIKPNEVNLYNGSGFPVFVDALKLYNQASCAAILDMLADFRHMIHQHGLKLEDFLPVAGKDRVEDGNSTVTQIYGNELTAGALIGKTGSVLGTIALAGLIVTENENLFFQTSFNVDNTSEDRLAAYNKIKAWLARSLIKDKKKSSLINYKPKIFLPFDSNSGLKKIEPFQILN